ncbi:vWA domain-containing protein [Bacillus sp. FJAT-27245]|uniref:vWA domain-containing protein n=1 Tax=Bacillus sp. FJAT-27245 TaxID=1684144 RepID=UPI0006A77902|nr:BatA and WFA domain-containing protein [Bacillus sp. FJAT-27245]
MHFANPAYFALAGLFGFVILLYFFRKQYKPVINPSNMLWAEAMNEWQASPWLKKLQNSLLLWLQVITLALLMFALAKPGWESGSMAGNHLVIIYDPSSSMSAAAGDDGTRVDVAKKKMLELLEKGGTGEVTIISAGQRPEVILNREAEKRAASDAIQSLSLTYEHENIVDAVKLALSLSSTEGNEIHIFSDAALKDEIEPVAGNAFIQVHNSRAPIRNVALLSFGAARAGNAIAAAAVLENQGSEDRDVLFTVKGEKEVLFEKSIKIGAASQEIIDIPDLPEQPYYLAEAIAEDGYQADNEAAAVLAPADPPFFAIGNVNPFLLKGVKSLGLDIIQPDQSAFASIKEGILLVEGKEPENLPNLPVLLINKDKGQRLELMKKIKAVDSPLLQFTEFGKTYIHSAAEPYSGSFETIAESGGRPLIQTGYRKGQPAIAVNFAIEDSDWPLHPGFPIFLSNSYQWLSKQSTFLGYFQPGEEKWLTLDSHDRKLAIFDRDGKNLAEYDLSTENFKAPFKPGVYQASSGKKIHFFSVMLDDREKTAPHSESFSLNKKTLIAGKKAVRENETAWQALGILAFLCLLMEWEVYRRGLGR